jgi:assimilatory nitrate reductase catalytic subunit
MTRSGQSPRLGAHLPEPFVEVHPADAEVMALIDGGFARVATRFGSCVLKVAVTDRQRRGSLFAPIHWSDASASAARICDLVMPETDRYSGQPDAKATPATITPVTFAYRGFALARQPLVMPDGTWWARVAVAKASGLLLASNDTPEIWRNRTRDMFGNGAELAEYNDAQRGAYRVAAFVGGALVGCLFIGPAEAAPQWDAIKPLFEADTLANDARRVILSGRSADGLASAGPTVCACFGVGLAAIRAALQSGAATSVETIGAALRAGTNCGSCLPELKRIVADGAAAASAATTAPATAPSHDRARDPAVMA